MKARSVRVLLGLVLFVLGVSYAVIRAQDKKPDILVQIHIYQNGSELANPNIAVVDGVQSSIRLEDGTELKVTASTIKR